MDRLFVDTSAWFAYGNRRDPDHGPVRKILNGFEGRLVTSNFVVHETVTLCLYRRGHAVATRIGSTLLASEGVDLVRVSPEDERAAWALFVDRPDQTYSFTDCTSFVLMRRLGIDRVVAVDDDFLHEGYTVVPQPSRRRRR